METTLQPSHAIVRERERSFFTTLAIANALIILAGFAYSTYARIQLGDSRFGGPTLTTQVQLHAAVSTAWTVLLIVQSRLIAGRRIRLHRQLGMAGALLAIAVVVLGWTVAVAAVGRGVDAGEPAATFALRFFILPFQELVVFSILIGAAVGLRNRGGYHKRLMLLGTIALIPAATTRPFALDSLLGTLSMFGLGELIFVAALAIHDRRTTDRVHAATWWGGGLLLTTAVSRALIGGSDAWLVFARTFIR